MRARDRERERESERERERKADKVNTHREHIYRLVSLLERKLRNISR